MYTLLYLKWITDKDLLYSTAIYIYIYIYIYIGELLDVMCQPGGEGSSGGEWIHVYVWL